MTGRLSGKRTIVTGAGSGIGQAAARLFAAEGAHVMCADINGDAAAATATDIGERAISLAVDVSRPADCQAMVDQTVSAFGGLDAVYANAGVDGPGRAGDLDIDEWNRVIGVNLTGVWLSVRYAIDHLIAAGGGSLVLQASVGGVIGVPGIASYAAAKAGVIGLTRQMAVDYGPDGIRVNAICPGTVPTPLVRATYEKRGGFSATANAPADATVDELIDAAKVRHPIGRLGTTTDIAQLALHLASDESSWTTGTAIVIDGGMSAA
ncbi:SDR family NAD(P)-dependent oxidoreductase [Candidatus Poriferisocius sp.]|uniref:SDR family NAD(P)-dependent oxidoreductase n=1 Tax=Candidatus Poriferisocius sp. TaxID=3101276 RepID=UPI003B5CAE1E